METINDIDITSPAKIFLNMFDLTLGDGDSQELEIYDGKNNPVGKLYKSLSQVVINANINGYRLDACLTQYKGHRFITMRHRLFSRDTRRNNMVYFTVTGEDNYKVKGRIDITANCSEYSGLNCNCSATLEYKKGKRKRTVLHLNDGLAFFMADLKDRNTFKTLILDPRKIYHRIISGKFNEELKAYPHFRESQITQSKLGSSFVDATLVDKTIEDGKIIDNDGFIRNLELTSPRVSKDNVDFQKEREEIFIQQVKALFVVDTKIGDFLTYLCNGQFTIGETQLFKNLVSACYDNYSDELMDAVIGIERDRSFYQDGANNLTEAYFKINSDSVKTKSIGQGE